MIEICSFPKHFDYHDPHKVKAVARKIKEVGLDPFSFHAPFADHIDITSLDKNTQSNSVAEIILATEAAAELGVRHLVLHPGPEREKKAPSVEFYHHLETASYSINKISKRCKELGITLLLENMLPHLLCGRTQDMLYIMGAMDEINVGTCLDTGHAYLSQDLPSVVHKLSFHLSMVHVNDNNGTGDDHLPPGEGSIDWPEVIAQLDSYNFRGPLIIELSARHGTDYDKTMAEARKSRDFIQKIHRALELK